MSRLSRGVIKGQLVQAIFDVLDELESSPQYTTEMSIQKEAETIADAVFQVITETDDEDLGIAELFSGTEDIPEITDEEV